MPPSGLAFSEEAILPLGLQKMCQGMMSLAIEGVTSAHGLKHSTEKFRGHSSAAQDTVWVFAQHSHHDMQESVIERK